MATDPKADGAFREWALLELMGDRRIAGLVSEATIGGASLVRIDVPDGEGTKLTQFYSPSAIYAITPVSEAVARRLAVNMNIEPVTRWDVQVPALPAKRADADDGENYEDDDL